MLNNYQIYKAFNRCQQIYGITEVHVQLIAKQLGVLASDVIDVINDNSSLYATRMNAANSVYSSKILGDEFGGLIITKITTIPYLTGVTSIREGSDGGTIVLTPQGDTFGASTSTGNWTVDVGQTGLTLASVNSATATKTLTFTGTAKPGTVSIKCKAAGLAGTVNSDTVYIDIPEINFGYSTISGVDTRLTALEKYIPVFGEPDIATAASEILIVGELPIDDDTVTIGEDTYTFVDSLSNPDEANEVLIGDDAEDCIDNLVTAINDGASVGVVSVGTVAHTLVSAVKKDADELTVTALVKGEAGNDIDIDSAFDSESNLWTESAANLSGGIDGDIAVQGQFYFDADKIYLAIDDCTVTDSNFVEYEKAT
jgi:hypothetical protein